MHFGLSHYAIGIRRDIPIEVERTLSYWMNILMQCNPLDPEGACPDGNLASFFADSGGSGEECGYVLFPATSDGLSPGQLAAIVLTSVTLVIFVYTLWHKFKLAHQKRVYMRKHKTAMAIAARERELNEFIAHEVRNPLASAIAALSFVSSKTMDPSNIPDSEKRALIKSDVDVIDSSLQFVNELLR